MRESGTSRATSGDVDAVAVRRGRSSPTYTDVHDWVMYSGATPSAIALYAILRSHVNRQRGDDAVWTSTLTLSVLLRLSRGDKVKPYLDELVSLGALTITRGGLHRKNEYEVHALPPDGYAGPTSGPDWYQRNKPLLAERRDQEKRVRDQRRSAKKFSKPASLARNDAAVTPSGGEQETWAVTPPGGEQVTPPGGLPVTLSTGREPDEVEPDEGETTIPPAQTEPHAACDVEADGGEEAFTEDQAPAGPTARELLDAAIDRARKIRTTWTEDAIKDAMKGALAAGRSADTVAAEFVAMAEGTWAKTPNGFQHWLEGIGRESGPARFVPAPSPQGKPRCLKSTAHQPFERGNCPICTLEENEAKTGIDDLGDLPTDSAGKSPREIALALAAKASSSPTKIGKQRLSGVRGPKDRVEPINVTEPGRASEMFGDILAGRS